MNSFSHVVTLIANPASANLTQEHVAAAAGLLPSPGAPDWLAPAIAVDIPFTPQDTAPDAGQDMRLQEQLRQALASEALDVAVQPAAGRRKQLFLADMDSTIIGQECIDELADLLGLKPQVAAITERAMRGEMEFEPALRERVALLRGLRASVIDQVLAERITLNPGAVQLVRTLRAAGAYTVLVSGGFTLFTRHIAALAGFHETRANELLVENGAFSGAVREPVLGRQAKLDALLELRERLGLDAGATLAVGDGANDLAMIEQAGLGVAYRAKPAVAAAAQVRIDHGDLTALLYAQGYRRAEFTSV